jgi:hypothetical protein
MYSTVSFTLPFLLLLLAGAGASAAELSGRGIHPLASRAGCPFSQSGTEDCNRIALDDTHTVARLDTEAGTINFHNDRQYRDKAIVADLLVHGTGESAAGARVPLSFHLVLSKDGARWSASHHVHAPVLGKFAHVEIDPYTVEVGGSEGTQVMLTPQQMREALEHPGYKARLARELVTVRDNRTSPASPPDITVSLGRGPLAASVLRARLAAPAGNSSQADLDALLHSDTWALELTALTGHLPRDVVRRELFLLQLDALPLLQALLRGGFHKHERLALGAVKGKGYISFQGRTVDFPGAQQAARSYLQQSFIGLILGSQQLARDGSHAR